MYKKLFHVTSNHESYLSILRNGLKASCDGYIYLLTTLDVAGYVAVNQLHNYKQYGVVAVKPKGIEDELEPDLVGEITAAYQVRVKQKLIEPKYIKGVNMFWVTPELLTSRRTLAAKLLENP